MLPEPQQLRIQVLQPLRSNRPQREVSNKRTQVLGRHQYLRLPRVLTATPGSSRRCWAGVRARIAPVLCARGAGTALGDLAARQFHVPLRTLRRSTASPDLAGLLDLLAHPATSPSISVVVTVKDADRGYDLAYRDRRTARKTAGSGEPARTRAPRSSDYSILREYGHLDR